MTIPPALDPRLENSTPSYGNSKSGGSVVYGLLGTRGARGPFWVVLCLALGLLICLPRAIIYRSVLDENLELKEQLQRVDQRMTDVERVLLRLRLYDAQFRDLTDPIGDHGPLTTEAFKALSNNTQEMPSRDLVPLDLEVPMEPFSEEDGLYSDSDLRPASAWAEAVHARAETFLAMFERVEPNFNELVEDLEDLRALEAALPSTWPGQGKLTSGFGWRKNPFGKAWKFHSGIDIAGARGKPVYAAAPGAILKAQYTEGYGRLVEIDHGYGISTFYAHCHALLVRKGAVVREGQQIATIGSTGRSTGPHLHFEVRLDGNPVDPMTYLPR